MTYSIVARDAVSGELGMAVHSRVFGVGRALHHVRGGVGAVNSQAMALPAHATRTLDGIAAGATAAEALEDSLSRDEARERRQVIALDADGGTAAHTGSACIASAGHHVGPDWVVAGNILADGGVVTAMEDAARTAWRDQSAPLPARLLAVLEAAEAAGGDVRGSQSASMVVTRAHDTGDPVADRIIDVRVDDHPDPVGELGRLVALAWGDELLGRAQQRLDAGDGDDALQAFTEALDRLAPMRDTAESIAWAAVNLAAAGRADDAATVITRLRDHPQRASMEELTRRLAEVGRVAPADLARWWPIG